MGAGAPAIEEPNGALYDLLVKNGKGYDPSQNIEEQRDSLAIRGGKIVLVEKIFLQTMGGKSLMRGARLTILV